MRASVEASARYVPPLCSAIRVALPIAASAVWLSNVFAQTETGKKTSSSELVSPEIEAHGLSRAV